MAALTLAPYAGILALIYICLAVCVIRLRYRYQTALGSGEHGPLARAIRAHSHFAEYVPLILLLLYLLVELGTALPLIHAMAMALVLSRLTHPYSLMVVEPRSGSYRLRTFSMVLTFTILGFSGLLLLVGAFHATYP